MSNSDGTERCWDNEECPRDNCEGELQQQDKLNVTCLLCEAVWSHVKTRKKHYLQTVDFEIVAEKPVAMADGGIEQLESGSILRRGEELFIVERGPTPAGDIVVQELGGRLIKEKRMFDIGNPCPIPTCDGEVVKSSLDDGRRRCSEGCLEWLPGRPMEDHDCPTCEKGKVVNHSDSDKRYTLRCTNDDCGWLRGGVQEWREAWWPNSKDEILTELDSRNAHSVDTGNSRQGDDS